MQKKDRKRDPIPPPDATPEEIGDFWDTHSLSDIGTRPTRWISG